MVALGAVEPELQRRAWSRGLQLLRGDDLIDDLLWVVAHKQARKGNATA